MKVLDTNNLLSAAFHIKEAHPVTALDLEPLERAVEEAHSKLATHLAYLEGVIHCRTATELGFGGLCSDFAPGPDGKTSDIIGDEDEGGDWDD